MITFNDQYLNKTANKTARNQRPQPTFVVWHETASPNPDNPHGTLGYNLVNDGHRGSYHYLIARDGTIYRYLDPAVWIAWGAGVRSSARGYSGGEVNTHSINVEIDGRNDGTGVTGAQLTSAGLLALYIRDTYKIPLSCEHHLGHDEVAPGYKKDPEGYAIDTVLKMAQSLATPAEPKILEVFDLPRRYEVKGPKVWLRSSPYQRSDNVRESDTPAGLSFLVDVVVEGDLVNGSKRWLRLKDWGRFVHESQVVHVVPEPAGSGGDSPERTARLEGVKKLAHEIVDRATALGFAVALLEGKQP